MQLPGRYLPKKLRATEQIRRYAAGMSLGARLRAAREAAGLTQTAVGHHLGKAKSVICHWENDDWRPGIDDRVDLARLLGVPFAELLPEAEPLVGDNAGAMTDPNIQRIVQLLPSIAPSLREVILMACAKLAEPDSPPAAPAGRQDVLLRRIAG